MANIEMRARLSFIRPRSRTRYCPLPRRRGQASPTGYVRLSVGIEHDGDVLADLDRALDKSAVPLMRGELITPAAPRFSLRTQEASRRRLLLSSGR
jgi:hypothetical protein